MSLIKKLGKAIGGVTRAVNPATSVIQAGARAATTGNVRAAATQFANDRVRGAKIGAVAGAAYIAAPAVMSLGTTAASSLGSLSTVGVRQLGSAAIKNLTPLTTQPTANMSLLSKVQGAIRTGQSIVSGARAIGNSLQQTGLQMPGMPNRPPNIPAPVGGLPLTQAGIGGSLGTIGGLVGRLGGGLIRKAAKNKWVRSVIGGVVTWILVDAAGNIIATRDKPPTRRMNALNPRALRRANKRVCGFSDAARPILRELGYQVSATRSARKGCGTKKKRRSC